MVYFMVYFMPGVAHSMDEILARKSVPRFAFGWRLFWVQMADDAVREVAFG